MVFSSLPLYHHLDSSNWHQQSNEQHHHHQQLLISAHRHQHEANGGGLPNHGGGGGVGGGGSGSSIKPNSMVDRARQAQIPLPEPGQKCPRCESTNTKFCYFNNYSLSQPRHFCKTCRRYWTRGGALRNVPVGGGSRRTTKRSKGRSSTSSGGNNNNSNVSNGSSRSPMIGGGGGGSVTSGGSSCSTSLFLTPNNMPQFPFLPSSLHHHLGNSNPNGIGLSLLGGGGAEMEFPFMGSFEGLGRINGMMQHMHPFENSTTHGSVELLGGRLMPNHHPAALQPKPLDPEVLDRVASVKLEDSQRLNLAKDFEVIQPTNEHQHHQYNWNNSSVWTTSDLSDYNSPSSTSHHLLG